MYISKKEIITVVIFCIFLFNNSCSTSFTQFSNSVKKQTSEKKQVLSKIRKDLFKQGALNFIDFNSDTIFLINLWEYESGFIYGKIWNKRGYVNYSYGQSNLQIRKDNYPFKEETIELINEWDRSKINVSQSETITLPSYQINAIRVILKNQEILTDSIKVKY